MRSVLMAMTAAGLLLVARSADARTVGGERGQIDRSEPYGANAIRLCEKAKP